jgi:hypothetical protein
VRGEELRLQPKAAHGKQFRRLANQFASTEARRRRSDWDILSLKRLTIDERATYLLGLGVRQQFEEAPRDPDTVCEIAAVARWMEHWLTWWELMIIEQETGFYTGDAVFCSNRHRRPLLARAMSRYVPRSALFDQGNRNERADYVDLAG